MAGSKLTVKSVRRSKVPAWLAPLLRLMEWAAGLVRRARKQREQEERQDEVDQLQDDPVEYGRSHFNRVRDDAEVPRDAGTSSDTNIAQLDRERARRREPGSSGH